MFISLKEDHEQECLYRHYQCFFINCSWKGFHSEVHSHMIKNHNNNVLTGSEQFFKIIFDSGSQTLKWFLSAEGEYFVVIIHVTECPPYKRRIKFQVNLFGSKVKANKFKFFVEFTQRKKRSGFSQKLIYESSTLSYSEIDDAEIHSNLKKNIISLTSEMIEPFVRRRDNLSVPFTLKVVPV
uniref:Uncharacterized protein n=1 Tax=Schizaphis graminum TaxID=13262 RepID=A0A2S2NXD8_SCHGA